MKENTRTDFGLFDQKVLVVVGKGGTGRTTISRALALLGTRSGRKVSVIAGTSGTHFQDTEDPLMNFTSLEPGKVLTSYLQEHGLGQLGKRLSSTGLASVISTAIPGIADLLVLAKIKQMERSQNSDLIIFDAPASGHFLKLIATPKGLSEIAAVGPLRKQSQEVLEMLEDHERLGVAFVTIPEETPVSETIETMQKLKENSGITPKALFINSLLSLDPKIFNSKNIETLNHSSPAYAAAKYCQERSRSQIQASKRASRAFGQKAIELPVIPSTELTALDIEILATVIERQIRTL